MNRLLIFAGMVSAWTFLLIALAMLVATFLPMAWLLERLASFGEGGGIGAPTIQRLFLAMRLYGALLFLVGLGIPYVIKRRADLIPFLAQSIVTEVRHFGNSLHQVFREDRIYVVPLLIIMAVGFLVRWHYLWRPIQYDEAFTFFQYASRSWYFALTDYGTPNNHLFHTWLVNRCLSMGHSVAVIRLPAFVAGMLIIPAVYFLGRRLMSAEAGLLAAALVAAAAPMVDYSTDARGYTLVILFSILCWMNAASVLRRGGLGAWVGLVVYPALGFYTIPTMLYPYVSIILWFAFSVMIGDTPLGRIMLMRQFAGAIFGAGVLTILLYTPVFIFSGVQAVIANPFIVPMESDVFWRDLPGHLSHLAEYFALGLPRVVVAALLFGVIFAVVRPRAVGRFRVPLLFPLLLTVCVLLPLQRQIPVGGLGRVLLYLLPFILLVAAGGWAHILQRAIGESRCRLRCATSVVACILVLLLGRQTQQLEWISSLTILPDPTHYEDEEVVLFLKPKLGDGDSLLTDGLLNTFPLRYYFLKHEISDEHLQWDPDDVQTLYVLRKHSGLLSPRVNTIMASIADATIQEEHVRDFPYSSLYRYTIERK